MDVIRKDVVTFLVAFLLTMSQLTAGYIPNLCEPGRNCELPQAPVYSFLTKDTPQLVLLTVDGNLSPAVSQRLFNANKRNPDDCPISVTSFVDQDNVDIVATNAEIQRGMEVSVLGKVNVRDASEKIGYRNILAVKTNMMSKVSNLQKVLGWRSNDIKQAGRLLFNALSYIGFTYDSSLLIDRPKHGSSFQWPFRLTSGWSLPPCPQPNLCEKGSFPNLWEFPITSLFSVKEQKTCYTLGKCTDALSSEEVRDLLLGNLKLFYLGNRAPFVLRIPADWLENKTQNVDALDAFIRQLSLFDDIYVVSIEKTIKWLFNPTPLNELNQLKEWQCSLYSSALNKPYRKYPDHKGPLSSAKGYPQTPEQESVLKNWGAKSRKERTDALFSKPTGAAHRTPTTFSTFLFCLTCLYFATDFVHHRSL